MVFIKIIDFLFLLSLIAMAVLIIICVRKKNYRAMFLVDLSFMMPFSAWGFLKPLIQNKFEWREHWSAVVFFTVFVILFLMFLFGKPVQEDENKP